VAPIFVKFGKKAVVLKGLIALNEYAHLTEEENQSNDLLSFIFIENTCSKSDQNQRSSPSRWYSNMPVKSEVKGSKSKYGSSKHKPSSVNKNKTGQDNRQDKKC